MKEIETLDEAVSLLEEKYGKEQVVVEPTLRAGQVVYPDIAVFRDTDHTSPHLLVEWSSLRTSHRRKGSQRDFRGCFGDRSLIWSSSWSKSTVHILWI